jgi:hypothetical protein
MEIGYIAAMADVNVFHLIVLGLHCYMLVSYSEVPRVHLVTLGSQFCSQFLFPVAFMLCFTQLVYT